jgi:hypothetical protein
VDHGLGPDEGLCAGIVVGDEAVDVGNEIGDAVRTQCTASTHATRSHVISSALVTRSLRGYPVRSDGKCISAIQGAHNVRVEFNSHCDLSLRCGNSFVNATFPTGGATGA